jgi:hypothetical protein
MNIVICGAKERNTEEDKRKVQELMNRAVVQYPNCVFVTILTHMGIGRFVKEACLEKGPGGQFRFQLIECSVRLYATQLSKSEVQQIYIARNATVFELADITYYFANRDRRGTLEDLVERLQKENRPCRVLLPGDPVELI